MQTSQRHIRILIQSRTFVLVNHTNYVNMISFQQINVFCMGTVCETRWHGHLFTGNSMPRSVFALYGTIGGWKRGNHKLFRRLCGKHHWILYGNKVNLNVNVPRIQSYFTFCHRRRVDLDNRTSLLDPVVHVCHRDSHLLVPSRYIIIQAISWPSPRSSSFWLDHEYFTLGSRWCHPDPFDV